MITTSTLVLATCILTVSTGIDVVNTCRRAQERGQRGLRSVDLVNILVKATALALVVTAIVFHRL